MGLRSGAPASVRGAQARCAVDEARPLQPCRRRAASDREQIDRAGRCLPDHWNRARWPPLKRLAHRCAVRRRPLPTQRGGRWKLRTPDPSAPGHPSSLPVIPTLLWRLPPDPSPLRPSLVPSAARRLDFLSPCAGARGHGGAIFGREWGLILMQIFKVKPCVSANSPPATPPRAVLRPGHTAQTLFCAAPQRLRGCVARAQVVV